MSLFIYSPALAFKSCRPTGYLDRSMHSLIWLCIPACYIDLACKDIYPYQGTCLRRRPHTIIAIIVELNHPYHLVTCMVTGHFATPPESKRPSYDHIAPCKITYIVPCPKDELIVDETIVAIYSRYYQ